MRECLSFDDVLLVPKYTEKRSRTDPGLDTSTMVGGVKLDIPMISSPMDTVTEEHMAVALGHHGGMGVIHRFFRTGEDGVYDQIKIINKILKFTEDDYPVPIVPAIGVGSAGREWFDKLYESTGPYLTMVAIDIANGHSLLMSEMINHVRQVAGDSLPIMAGNVATAEGFAFLAEAGANAVRVGIGGGSICKTRIQTGFGVPTLASVMDCEFYRAQGNYEDVSILADGGIKHPKDMIFSLAAGADAVICGSVFAGTKEAPGEVIEDNNGKAFKKYRGMASEEIQREKRGGLKEGTCAEGVSMLTPYKGSLNRVIANYIGGLRSAFTYNNASNIEEFRLNSEFIKITSAGLSESHAFGTR